MEAGGVTAVQETQQRSILRDAPLGQWVAQHSIMGQSFFVMHTKSLETGKLYRYGSPEEMFVTSLAAEQEASQRNAGLWPEPTRADCYLQYLRDLTAAAERLLECSAPRHVGGRSCNVEYHNAHGQVCQLLKQLREWV